MDEEGIISKDDSKVLVAARKLQKLLRKVNFPSSFNKEFHDFLMNKQNEYHSKLDFLIVKLQKGSRPVYYADLVNQKYASELKALDAFVNHDTLQAVFVTNMYDHFIIGRRGYLSYTDTLKEYALRSKQLYGSRKHKMELFYEDGSVAIVRGLITSLSEDSRYSEQEEWKILHTSYLCSEAFHLRV